MDIDNRVMASERGQAMPAQVLSMGAEALGPQETTTVTWLGGAGLLVNARGATVMVDPVLEGFDMPVLFDAPLAAEDVSTLDALLVTHIDNDHFGRPTCTKLARVCERFHAPAYVASVMRDEGMPGVGHDIDDVFEAAPGVVARLTPAWHNWQNESKKWGYRTWKREDYCGYWLDTPDGSIWLPGDSRLLDEHLHMPAADLIVFDFSDNDWHITFDGAVELANAYPDSRLLCIHWGTVDAPDWSTFNADPRELAAHVVNPERVLAAYPGEPVTL